MSIFLETLVVAISQVTVPQHGGSQGNSVVRGHGEADETESNRHRLHDIRKSPYHQRTCNRLTTFVGHLRWINSLRFV